MLEACGSEVAEARHASILCHLRGMAPAMRAPCACVLLASAAMVADAVTRISLQRRGQLTKAAKRAAGAGVALGYDDSYTYFGEIELGTPGQIISVSFDTTIAYSWIPALAALRPVSSHAWYVPEQSSTYQPINRVFHEWEGDGKCARDLLTIGSLHVQAFEFGLVAHITNISSLYEAEGDKWDGVLGLGLSGASVPLLQQLVNEKQIDEPAFAFYLDRMGERSELSLGGPAPERQQGDFHFVGLAAGHGSSWGVDLDAVWIGYSRCFTGATLAFVNPWNVLAKGPEDQVKSFVEAWDTAPDSDGFLPILATRMGRPSCSAFVGGTSY